MSILNIEPGPKIGQILDILLSEVLDEPDKNNERYLEKKVKELRKLSDDELKEKAKRAREKINQIVEKRDQMTKQKYWVS